MRNEPVYILLADDDEDDRNLFNEAFNEIEIKTEVDAVHDGVELMAHLIKHPKLPQVLFLDLNMPGKNGIDCLIEIKKNTRYKDISIAIYSTSGSEKDVEETFVNGANVYIKKPNDFKVLKKILSHVICMNWQYHNSRLNRDNFLLRMNVTELI